ncbi:MAG: hypothetical protein LBF97_07250, partial [Elusimicrobiota bacterium]|nr:hypothetical protein [Elusimicrobiota bacterium]
MNIYKKMKNIYFQMTILLLFVFVVNNLQNYVYAFPANATDLGLMIPIKYGKAIEKFEAGSDEKYYIIQDLHCQPTIQKNIYNIIKELKKTYKDELKKIYLEGSYEGKIETKILDKISDKDIKEKFVEYLFSKGYISGAELYGIKHINSIELEGIEDKKLYENNFEVFYKALSSKDELGWIFKDISKGLNIAKEHLYNERMKKFEIEVERYNRGEISLEKYLEIIKDIAKKIGIDINIYENIKEILELSMIEEKANKLNIEIEAKHVIKKIYGLLTQEDKKELENNKGIIEYYSRLDNILENKKINISRNYKDLCGYIEYIKRLKEINDIGVYEEKIELEDKIREKLLEGTADGEELNISDRYLNLLERYLWNKASYKEVQIYEGERKNYERIKRFTNRLLRKKYLNDNEKEIIEAENNMARFYELANKRSEVLVRNMSKNSNDSLKVMIIGGYHIDKIKESLKARGISYEIIMPNIMGEIRENIYIRRIKEQAQKLGIKNNKIIENEISVDTLMVSSIFQNLRTEKNKMTIKELVEVVFYKLEEPEKESIYKEVSEYIGLKEENELPEEMRIQENEKVEKENIENN